MKSTNRLSDLKTMSEDQLDQEVLTLKKEQFNLRFQARHRAAREHRACSCGAPRYRRAS